MNDFININTNIENRKVKFIKFHSNIDYGDVNPDEIELNNLMPNQANLNLLYADVNFFIIF